MIKAYIWASAVWQIAMIGGGATLTYLSGSLWWFAGGFFLSCMQSYSFSKRLDQWSREDSQ